MRITAVICCAFGVKFNIMELLDKVKTDLEKNKNYDFESDFWTDEILCVLYDAVYATEQTIKDKY